MSDNFEQPQASSENTPSLIQPASPYQSSAREYSELQPPMPPISPKPTKQGFFKKKVTMPLWLLIILIVLAIGGLGSATSKSSATSTDTNQSNSSATSTDQSSTIDQSQATDAPTLEPSPTPTHTPKWVITQTFTGNGSKKTNVFTVGDDWKIIWSCDPSSSFSGQYNLIVEVDNSDGTPLDPVAVNTICQSGNTSDNTEEYQGGNVYLNINSEGAWKLQIQELQ